MRCIQHLTKHITSLLSEDEFHIVPSFKIIFILRYGSWFLSKFWLPSYFFFGNGRNPFLLHWWTVNFFFKYWLAVCLCVCVYVCRLVSWTLRSRTSSWATSGSLHCLLYVCAFGSLVHSFSGWRRLKCTKYRAFPFFFGMFSSVTVCVNFFFFGLLLLPLFKRLLKK